MNVSKKEKTHARVMCKKRSLTFCDDIDGRAWTPVRAEAHVLAASRLCLAAPPGGKILQRFHSQTTEALTSDSRPAGLLSAESRDSPGGARTPSV